MDKKMKDELSKAILLLNENGYVVKKLTQAMHEDSDKCEACGFEGDCSACACSVCIVQ